MQVRNRILWNRDLSFLFSRERIYVRYFRGNDKILRFFNVSEWYLSAVWDLTFSRVNSKYSIILPSFAPRTQEYPIKSWFTRVFVLAVASTVFKIGRNGCLSHEIEWNSSLNSCSVHSIFHFSQLPLSPWGALSFRQCNHMASYLMLRHLRLIAESFVFVSCPHHEVMGWISIDMKYDYWDGSCGSEINVRSGNKYMINFGINSDIHDSERTHCHYPIFSLIWCGQCIWPTDFDAHFPSLETKIVSKYVPVEIIISICVFICLSHLLYGFPESLCVSSHFQKFNSILWKVPWFRIIIGPVFWYRIAQWF
jgi:hypothetical protein